MVNYETENIESFIDKEELAKTEVRGSSIFKSYLDAKAPNHVMDLGWVNPDKWASEAVLLEAEAIADKVKAYADTLVVIGVGGSNNACRSVIEAISPKNGLKVIYAGNILSPFTLKALLDEIETRSIVIDCIAKNFETLEPGITFRTLRQHLQKKYGKDYNKRVICTGSEGSRLEDIARANGYAFFPFPLDIGGRFTALSPVHLVPMAIAGIDIRALTKGAKDQYSALVNTNGSMAVRYASIRYLLLKKGYRVELLSSFEPRLKHFFLWWKQLFAESEGKEETGLLPISGEFSEELHSLGQYIQQGAPILFETFLDVSEKEASVPIYADGIEDGFAYLDGKDYEDLNRASFHATRLAHSKRLPCSTIMIDRINEYSFGSLFYFFQAVCAVSGTLLGVNPFDQPGVELYKKAMFSTLGKK